MTAIAVNAHDIVKFYRLGSNELQYRTFTETVVDIIKSPWRNLVQLRRLTLFNNENDTDMIRALDGVSFQVEEGEVPLRQAFEMSANHRRLDALAEPRQVIDRRSHGYRAVKECTVVCVYASAGLRITEGNSGRFGESG